MDALDALMEQPEPTNTFIIRPYHEPDPVQGIVESDIQNPRAPKSSKQKAKSKVKRSLAKASRKQNRR